MTTRQRRCRIAIVGAQRARVAKVLSLIDDDAREIKYSGNDDRCTVTVEYLPCVARFDSYENENGEAIRYLASMEYHGLDGTERGSNLAPFFDAEGEADESKLPTFPGISAVAIGCGIETQDDVAMIEKMVRSLVGQNNASRRETISRDVIVHCVTPNLEYASMKEENEAYKALDASAKEEATHLQVIGPGKMAKFSSTLAKSVVDRAWHGDPGGQASEADDADRHYSEDDTCGNAPQTAIAIESVKPESREVDPTKVRYACRMCRKILFGKDDLEDPPHVPSQHNFTRRNAYGSRCASLFISNGLDWMGDMSPVEGKFNCPTCASKIGTWKWAGAQCSCGTWVTPAIQVPSSKVDEVAPDSGRPPPGTIVSRHVGIAP